MAQTCQIKKACVVVIDVLLTFLWQIATFNLSIQFKVVLAEKNKSNKWLSEQLDKDPAIISKWVTNTTQPNVEMLIQIAKVLDVSVDELLRTK